MASSSTKKRRKELLDSMEFAFTHEKIAKYVAEFIGTAWLVLLIKLSVPNFMYPSVPIGGGLCCIIYTYGYISYAHYNPSITLAFSIRNIPQWPRSDTCQILMYYLVEYLGATCGGLLGWLIGGSESAYVYPSALNNGSSTYILLRAFIAEFVFTFILASVILHVATDKRQAKNQFYGLSIGLVVTVSIMCIGSISGCCLNSAVWVGCIVPALLASMLSDDDVNIDVSDAWIYWIAPFLGAALSAIVVNTVFIPKSRDKDYDAEDERSISLKEFNKEYNKEYKQLAKTDDPERSHSIIVYEN